MRKNLLKEISNSLRQRTEEKPDYARRMLSEMSTPVRAVKNVRKDWALLDSPRILSKVYEFESRAALTNFVGELLAYEDQVNHHADICISHQSVSIEIYTKKLNAVTELDYEYAKTADLIYQDVGYYS